MRARHGRRRRDFIGATEVAALVLLAQPGTLDRLDSASAGGASRVAGVRGAVGARAEAVEGDGDEGWGPGPGGSAMGRRQRGYACEADAALRTEDGAALVGIAIARGGTALDGASFEETGVFHAEVAACCRAVGAGGIRPAAGVTAVYQVR